MKFKRLSIISFAAFIGFTLFYIGLNQWQHEKESTGKINIVSNMPNQTIQPEAQQNQPPQNPSNTKGKTSSQQPQTNTSNPQNQTTTPQLPQTTAQSQTPTQTTSPSTNTKPQTVRQIITQNHQQKPSPNTNKIENQGTTIFQIGAFKSSVSAQNAINKAKSLGFSPIVKQEKGFYIITVRLNGSKDGIKLLTAFPGAFKVR